MADSGEVYLFVTKNQMDESSVTEDYSDATLDDVLSYMADQWGYNTEDAEKDWMMAEQRRKTPGRKHKRLR